MNATRWCAWVVLKRWTFLFSKIVKLGAPSLQPCAITSFFVSVFFFIFPPPTVFISYWSAIGMKVIGPGCSLWWDICSVPELRSSDCWKRKREQMRTSENKEMWMERKTHNLLEWYNYQKPLCNCPRVYHWNTIFMSPRVWAEETAVIGSPCFCFFFFFFRGPSKQETPTFCEKPNQNLPCPTLGTVGV